MSYSDNFASAENRKMQAKIAELKHQIARATSEPSIDDRNQLADARSRADSVFQAALGRPVPDPIPGERPIAYRRRLAEPLKQFSPTLKAARFDNVGGAAFDVVEERIFADARAAVRANEVMPAGQLRAIHKRELGHDVTEYVGDPAVAWAPFTLGSGGTIKFNRALHKG